MSNFPTTMAIRVLREHGVAFESRQFKYEPKGGTAHSATVLGVDEHLVIKTLIFENEEKEPLVVLMHGDREVSAKGLARILGTKKVAPCLPHIADKHSGYQVGGTSPFGTKRRMPVYMERTIAALPKLYINGGARGFLVVMTGADVQRVLQPTLVDVAVLDT